MRVKVCIICSAFVISFLVYLFTLAPAVYWRDAAEFVHASYMLDVPHPTGSPMFLHIAKLLEFVPVGSIAFRANLASALLAAVGLGFFTLFLTIIMEEAGLERSDVAVCASAVALWFGFSGAVWEWSVAAEVYGLSICFLVLVFVFAWFTERTRDIRVGAITAFLAGLATGVHALFIMFIPVIAAFLLIAFWRSEERGRDIAVLAASGFLGCLVVFYAPLRSFANPLEDYGNPQTAGGLFAYLSGRSLQPRVLEYPLVCGVRNLIGILKFIAREFFAWPLVLAPFGVAWLLKRHPGYLVLVLGVAAFNWYAVKDWTAPFGYIPLIFALVVLAWFGLAFLASLVHRSKHVFAYFRLAITALFIGLALVCMLKNIGTYRRNSHVLTEVHGYSQLSSLPYGSVLLLEHGPTIFLALYQQSVLGYRQDVEVIPQPYLYDPAGLAQRHPAIIDGYTGPDVGAVAAWLERLSEKRGVFVDNPITFGGLFDKGCDVLGPFLFGCGSGFAREFDPFQLINAYVSYPYYARDYSVQEIVSSYADMIGALAHAAGRMDESKRWFLLSLFVSEQGPTGPYNLAQVELAEGDCERAVEHARLAYERRPCYPLMSTAELYCRALYQCRRYGQASIECERALSFAPHSDRVRYFYAMSLIMENDSAKGLHQLERVFWHTRDRNLLKASGVILLGADYFSGAVHDKACARLIKFLGPDADVEKFCARDRTR